MTDGQEEAELTTRPTPWLTDSLRNGRRAAPSRVSCFLAKIVILLLLGGVTHASAATIGILGDTVKCQPEVDELTHLLGETPDVVVVERSAIEKILAEHKVSLSSSNESCVESGRLIGADGMIILKELLWYGQTALSVRLVSVRTGAVVGSWIQSLSNDESCHWAKTVRDLFLPLFPKLDVSREAAIPLSLLYFHSLDNSSASKETERALTVLLAQRLTLEKEFFVLERWKLGNLEWEKTLKLDDSPFWTGSWTVSGRIDRISTKGDEAWIDVSVELGSKDAKEPLSFKLSGSLANIPALVDRLANEIRRKIGKDASQPPLPFDAAAEAELYAKESVWALRNKCYELALNAAESAKALGSHNSNLAYVIVFSATGVLNERIKPQFDQFNGYRVSQESLLAVEMVDIDGMLKALDSFDELIKTDPRPSDLSRFAGYDDWRVIGGDLLNKAGCVLRGIHLAQKHLTDPRVAAKAALLRKLCRELIGHMRAAGRGDNLELSYKCQLVFMPYFHEDKDETLKALDTLLMLDFPDSQRMRLRIRQNNSSLQYPWLISWQKMNPKSSKELRETFDSYTQQLLDSPSTASQIDALVLKRNLVTTESVVKLLQNNAAKIASTPHYSHECFELLPTFIWRLKQEERDEIHRTFVSLSKRIMDSPGMTNFHMLYLLHPWNIATDGQQFEQLYKKWNECRLRQAKTHPHHLATSDYFRWIDEHFNQESHRWMNGISSPPPLAPSLTLDSRIALRESTAYFKNHRNTSFTLRQLRYEAGKILISGTLGDGQSAKNPVLFAVDAKTLHVDEFPFPDTIDGHTIEAKDWISSYHSGSAYFVDKGGDLLKSSGGQCVLMENLNCQYPLSMAFANEKLYVGFGRDMDVNFTAYESSSGKGWVSGIVEKSLKDDTPSSHLACNARNPGKAYFDNCKPYEVLQILQGPAGSVLAGIYARPCYRLMRIDNPADEWKQLLHNHRPADGRVFDSPHPGGCLFSCKQLCHIWNYDSATNDVVLLRSKGQQRHKGAAEDGKLARWDSPLEYDMDFSSNSPYGRTAAFDGSNLFLVATEKNTNGAQAPCLACFREGFDAPFKISLVFPSDTDDRICAFPQIAIAQDRVFLFTSGNPASPSDCALWNIDKRALERKLESILPMPKLTPEDKFFDGSVRITIADKDDKAEIRYTLEGLEPDADATRFSAPFELDASAFLAAKAFREGASSSRTAHQLFLKLPRLKATQNTSLVNGLRYSVHYGGWVDIPDLSKVNVEKTGVSTSVDAGVAGRDYAYGVSFNGHLNVPSDGLYRFESNRITPFRLYLDGTLIGGYGGGSYNFIVDDSFASLDAGTHAFRVDLLNTARSDKTPFVLKWEGPGIELQQIPDTAFFHEQEGEPEK